MRSYFMKKEDDVNKKTQTELNKKNKGGGQGAAIPSGAPGGAAFDEDTPSSSSALSSSAQSKSAAANNSKSAGAKENQGDIQSKQAQANVLFSKGAGDKNKEASHFQKLALNFYEEILTHTPDKEENIGIVEAFMQNALDSIEKNKTFNSLIDAHPEVKKLFTPGGFLRSHVEELYLGLLTIKDPNAINKLRGEFVEKSTILEQEKFIYSSLDKDFRERFEAAYFIGRLADVALKKADEKQYKEILDQVPTVQEILKKNNNLDAVVNEFRKNLANPKHEKLVKTIQARTKSYGRENYSL